jgi:hypothetical protein
MGVFGLQVAFKCGMLASSCIRRLSSLEGCAEVGLDDAGGCGRQMDEGVDN